MSKPMGTVKCQECKRTVTRIRLKQKFCCASCKVKNWQQRTGYRGAKAKPPTAAKVGL